MYTLFTMLKRSDIIETSNHHHVVNTISFIEYVVDVCELVKVTSYVATM